MSSSRIKLITLDLDNTLWDVDSVIVRAEQDMRSWLLQHAPDSLLIYDSEQLADIRSHVLQHFGDQAHDLSFLRTRILFEVMQRTGFDTATSRRLAEGAFAVFFDGRNRVEFFPGALEMLAQLSSSFELYALTNGNADIHRAGLGEYMQGAFSSADVGVRKPHADMFLAPLRASDARPEQAVHIGDHLVDDISGAAGVGMHSVWVNLSQATRQHDQVEPTATVTELSSIPEVVRQIAEG